jgi:hypothetical protein
MTPARAANGRSDFLPRAVLTLFRDARGRVTGAYARVRPVRVKASRTIQPNPAVLLDLLLDDEGRAVGVALDEAVPGPAIVRTVERLLRGAGRRAAAPGRTRRRSREERAAVGVLLEGFFRANRAMGAGTGPRAC